MCFLSSYFSLGVWLASFLETGVELYGPLIQASAGILRVTTKKTACHVDLTVTYRQILKLGAN